MVWIKGRNESLIERLSVMRANPRIGPFSRQGDRGTAKLAEQVVQFLACGRLRPA
jgi:hypothetical protein